MPVFAALGIARSLAPFQPVVVLWVEYRQSRYVIMTTVMSRPSIYFCTNLSMGMTNVHKVVELMWMSLLSDDPGQ